MPIYVYQSAAESGCVLCQEGFEKIQKIGDAPLLRCPQCHGSVQRVVSAPHLPSAGPDLSPDKLEKHGFTQYRKLEKGIYEKTAGRGPRMLRDED